MAARNHKISGVSFMVLACETANNERDILWMSHGFSATTGDLTGAERRVAGWVAGGCWDYYENSYLVGGFNPSEKY